MQTYGERHEWLEPDGLGGFASGTATGVRTRRYHALLLAATTPPTGRVVLVNGVDAWLDTSAGSFALTSQRYEPGVIHPDAHLASTSFTIDPWPTWMLTLADGTIVEHAIVVERGAPVVVLTWKLAAMRGHTRLSVRPFFSGRDYHALHHENGAFRFEPEVRHDRLVWRPYDGIPAVHAITNGEYTHQAEWYRNFRYDEELARGLDGVEDLAAPGVFQWDLRDEGEAALVFGVAPDAERAITWGVRADTYSQELKAREQTRRAKFVSVLDRAADAYLVARGSGITIVAGYPWFTDWGRDTFIALRGICLAASPSTSLGTGRIDEARRILLEWSGAISEGMLPNRFPDRGETPEFNSVDASLWFVIAVFDLFDAATRGGVEIAAADRHRLEDAVDAILTGYCNGTRFGIRVDDDGLLAAGASGVQLTWMDARVGEHEITPRIGKPVEIEALWLNALWLAGRRTPKWQDTLARGRAAFAHRFWNEASGVLYDVVDVDHRKGTADPLFRPNQIFALGGLPLVLVDAAKTRRALDAIETRLWTPVGLRSLAPGEPGYVGQYGGSVASRDGAYHQGTVWPWLVASFVDAWVRARGGSREAKHEARERFLTPLLRHLDEYGLGHLGEIADADAPHRQNGCPFQAWSVGEALRLDHLILTDASRPSNSTESPEKWQIL
jgi:predicted glycogen debranching enzyme